MGVAARQLFPEAAGTLWSSWRGGREVKVRVEPGCPGGGEPVSEETDGSGCRPEPVVVLCRPGGESGGAGPGTLSCPLRQGHRVRSEGVSVGAGRAVGAACTHVPQVRATLGISQASVTVVALPAGGSGSPGGRCCCRTSPERWVTCQVLSAELPQTCSRAPEPAPRSVTRPQTWRRLARPPGT